MKEVGVNWALRKAGAACSSTTEITQVYFGILANELFSESQVKHTVCCIRSYAYDPDTGTAYDPDTGSIRSIYRKYTIF